MRPHGKGDKRKWGARKWMRGRKRRPREVQTQVGQKRQREIEAQRVWDRMNDTGDGGGTIITYRRDQ